MKYILLLTLSSCIIYDGKLRNKGAKVYGKSNKCHYNYYSSQDQEKLRSNCGYRLTPIE